ncbi:MAG: YegS/Rv2252/BmrU family lipid kinase [Caldilineae bacterium]|nr:MAG: YegS/Rv2252/BmrU family lipid kinase [Caldilineae bacterium]
MSAKRIKVILNPYAGRWKAKKHIEPLRETLAQLGFRVDLTVTRTPGEGIGVARQAAQAGFAAVVAAGGDSTVSEVVNGLVQAAGNGEAGTLGIVPLGTANDLSDMLGIPRDWRVACRRLLAGETRVIDVCRVNDRYFGNNSAVGLEPMVTLEAERIQRIKGPVRYIVAALRAISRSPHWQARLRWDGGSFEGPVTLVSVGNSPRTGGAFFMTPKAKLDDGLMDFVFAPALGRLSLLRLLPATFSGRHIRHRAVIYCTTTRLHIEMEPSPLQADGEVIDRQATRIEYAILPRKLRVIV